MSAEHDPLDLAAAALKMAHGAGRVESREDDQQDFALTPPPRRDSGRDFDSGGGRGFDRGRSFEREHSFDRGPRDERGPRGSQGFGAPRGGPPSLQDRGVDSVRLFVGAGRAANLRPGDLVGAITHEAGVPGSAIGAIHIAERHSLVEVRADVAENVMRALRNTTLRGRKVNVRPDRDG